MSFDGDTAEHLFELLKKHFVPKVRHPHTGNLPGQVCSAVLFRAPITKLAAHDAEYEAIELARDYLLKRDFPSWFALRLAVCFVRHTSNGLVPKNVNFVPSVYQERCGSTFCKMLFADLDQFCAKLLAKLADDGASSSIFKQPENFDSLPVAVCSMKNTRRKMEDKHVVLQSLKELQGNQDLRELMAECPTSTAVVANNSAAEEPELPKCMDCENDGVVCNIDITHDHDDAPANDALGTVVNGQSLPDKGASADVSASPIATKSADDSTDRVIINNVIADKDAFFAVFDGHGGIECANYAYVHLPHILINHPKYNLEPLEAVRQAVLLTDQRLTAKCKKEGIRSGATVVCCLVKDNKIHIAWCGDAPAAVMRSDKVTMLTECHTPENMKEIKRIEEQGGQLILIQGELRVNGVLNITRSIGDISAKPIITAEPGVLSMEIDDDIYLLLLSCDGVWDCLDETDINNSIREFVLSHQCSEFPKLAEHVLNFAKDSGSSDNLTIIVVFVRPVEDLWKIVR